MVNGNHHAEAILSPKQTALATTFPYITRYGDEINAGYVL
jgi:hypothetical protein